MVALSKKRVIIVTDGDQRALAAVEKAAQNVQGRCISLSGGHVEGDADLEPEEVAALVLSTPHDPVVVMVDDEGQIGEGRGERILRHLATHPSLDILGVVAVASNAQHEAGVEVTASVGQDGRLVESSVSKDGQPQPTRYQHGDTLGVLHDIKVPVVIGLGDPGKMDFADDAAKGAPLTTKALETILARHG